jgi:hypothetical protein
MEIIPRYKVIHPSPFDVTLHEAKRGKGGTHHMNSIDLFLVQYGLAAIFFILLVKPIGIPIPLPSDLIILTAAARVA